MFPPIDFCFTALLGPLGHQDHARRRIGWDVFFICEISFQQLCIQIKPAVSKSQSNCCSRRSTRVKIGYQKHFKMRALDSHQVDENINSIKYRVWGTFCKIFSQIGDKKIFAHENGAVVSPGIPVPLSTYQGMLF